VGRRKEAEEAEARRRREAEEAEAKQLAEAREAERRKEAERLKRKFLDTLDAAEVVGERLMRRDAEAVKQAERHESEQRRRQVAGSSGGEFVIFGLSTTMLTYSFVDTIYVRPPKVPTELVEGSDEDPTYSDRDEVEVKGSKGKGKASSKEKTKESEVEERWEVMTGTEVCNGCLWKGTDCEVNMAAVEKWEEDAAAGKPFTRTFAGAGCKSCKARKITCALPRTTELREMAAEKRKEEKEAAKRKREAVDDGEEPTEEVKPRPSKKPKVTKVKVSTGKVSKVEEKVVEGVSGELATLLEKIGRQVQRNARYQKRCAEALENLVEVVEDGWYVGGGESEEESEWSGSEVSEGELKGLREEAEGESEEVSKDASEEVSEEL
jgi:hypothetical protein